MVMSEHNKSINTRFRSNNDSNANENVYEPGSALTRYLKSLNANMEAIQEKLERGQIDIEAYEYEPSLGTITLSNPTRQPWLLTDVLATWNIAISQTPTASAFPSIATSGVAVQNPYDYTVAVTLAGFTATAVDVNGIPVGAGNGTYYVPAYGSLSVTYTVLGTTTAAGIATAEPPTSVTLTIKDRTYQLPAGAGQFQGLGMHGMQMDKDAQIKFTMSPASACFLQVMGQSDYRKIERSEAN